MTDVKGADSPASEQQEPEPKKVKVALDQADVVQWCKENKRQLIDRPMCSCPIASPDLAPGYKGYKGLVCTNCCERCPRCKQESTNNDYSTTGIGDYAGVCYGCAVGDNDSVKSEDDGDEDDDEEEDDKE